jgi:hypothetical protein
LAHTFSSRLPVTVQLRYVERSLSIYRKKFTRPLITEAGGTGATTDKTFLPHGKFVLQDELQEFDVA